MLTPIPSEEKYFPDKNYHEINRNDIPFLKEVYISYDPAGSSQEKKHSLDCIIVVGIDGNSNQYLLDALIKEGLRMDANMAIETIIFFAKKYGELVRGILVEKVLGSKFIRGLFENYCKKHDLGYTYLYKEEAVDYEKTKKDRIRILEIPWRNDQIFICSDIPEEIKSEVKEEFATFDKCRYYDILDAWAMISKYIIYTPKEEKIEDIKKESPFAVQNGEIKIDMGYILGEENG
jgi:patatin-like phospholipase/acyl hydrolase